MATTITFAGLNLLSGTPAAGGYICLGEVQLDGESMAWDVVRSYTGAKRQVDLHSVPWALPLRVMIYGTTAADLEAKKSALRTACMNGGTLALSWDGGSKSYTVWPGNPPLVSLTHKYLAFHCAEASLTLTICP